MQKHWISYQGQFFEDKKSGFGIINFTNGDRFEGRFDNDIVNGSGTYFYQNEKTIQGIWSYNKLIVS